MKSHMKKQHGNAFHRGWPQAKERYLDATLLHKDQPHKCVFSTKFDHNSVFITKSDHNSVFFTKIDHTSVLYPIQRSAPQSLSKLWSAQISRCYVTELQFTSFIEGVLINA